jgi:hypothetical protein
VTHWFDELRSEPRFQQILRRAGFIRDTQPATVASSKILHLPIPDQE